MFYQLRSRKDPASLDTQEQTDTVEGNPAETQVKTSGYEIVVPPQLSALEQLALPMAEANPLQVTSSTSAEPETVSDLQGPSRFDPDLGSAPVSVGVPSPADTVGPSSTVMSGRDATLIGNQPLQLHDSQEVKLTHTQGTTLVLMRTLLDIHPRLSCLILISYLIV